MKNIYQLQCILNLFTLQAFIVICQAKKASLPREKSLNWDANLSTNGIK